MSTSRNGGIAAPQLLFPLALVAFVVLLGTTFQTIQVFRDRAVLHDAKTQQDKPLEESRKVQAQLEALAVGTLKLADQGDKNAQAIIERLKQLGISVAPPKTGSTMPSTPSTAALPSKS